MRWGDTPADLDTYVVPSQVETLAGARVAWKTQLTDGSVEVVQYHVLLVAGLVHLVPLFNDCALHARLTSPSIC